MKIVILAVGRLKKGAERTLFEHYTARFAACGRAAGFAGIELGELIESRNRSAGERRLEEARRLRDRWGGRGPLLVLDAEGTAETSEGFARRLQALRADNPAQLTFVIGGPDGLHPDFQAQACARISFGRMTYSHGLVRVLLAEQLYRAATILCGHPYHRA